MASHCAATAASAACSMIPSPDLGVFKLASGVPGAIMSCLHLAEFVYELKETPKDVKTCSALVKLISVDLKYLIALRMKTCNMAYLVQNPDLAQRIDDIIAVTQEGILDVGKLLEGCRQDIYAKGNVPVKARMKWVLADSKAFKIREGNLNGVHRAVLSEIQFLRMNESASETVKKVIEHDSFENLELLGMPSRRNHTKGMISHIREVNDNGLETSRKAQKKGTHFNLTTERPAADLEK